MHKPPILSVSRAYTGAPAVQNQGTMPRAHQTKGALSDPGVTVSALLLRTRLPRPSQRRKLSSALDSKMAATNAKNLAPRQTDHQLKIGIRGLATRDGGAPTAHAKTRRDPTQGFLSPKREFVWRKESLAQIRAQSKMNSGQTPTEVRILFAGQA